MSSSTWIRGCVKSWGSRTLYKRNWGRRGLGSIRKDGFMRSFTGGVRTTRLNWPIPSSRPAMPSWPPCCSCTRTLPSLGSWSSSTYLKSSESNTHLKSSTKSSTSGTTGVLYKSRFWTNRSWSYSTGCCFCWKTWPGRRPTGCSKINSSSRFMPSIDFNCWDWFFYH